MFWDIILTLIQPTTIFVLLAILAVILFFILMRRKKHRLEEMAKEDEWMQSLDDEWGKPES